MRTGLILWLVQLLVLTALALLVAGVLHVYAQTLLVNLDKNVFAWSWTGDNATIDGFNFTCNGQPQPGIIAAALRESPVQDTIKVPGVYKCTIAAVNKFGRSAESNLLDFEAGRAPAVPPGLSLRAR
jgi:hypothetical protein